MPDKKPNSLMAAIKQSAGDLESTTVTYDVVGYAGYTSFQGKDGGTVKMATFVTIRPMDETDAARGVDFSRFKLMGDAAEKFHAANGWKGVGQYSVSVKTNDKGVTSWVTPPRFLG